MQSNTPRNGVVTALLPRCCPRRRCSLGRMHCPLGRPIRRASSTTGAGTGVAPPDRRRPGGHGCLHHCCLACSLGADHTDDQRPHPGNSRRAQSAWPPHSGTRRGALPCSRRSRHHSQAPCPSHTATVLKSPVREGSCRAAPGSAQHRGPPHRPGRCVAGVRACCHKAVHASAVPQRAAASPGHRLECRALELPGPGPVSQCLPGRHAHGIGVLIRGRRTDRTARPDREGARCRLRR